MQTVILRWLDMIKIDGLQVDRETTVTIGRCRQLDIKKEAFISHFKPVALYSSYCHLVYIEESAFTRLSRLALTNIQSLHLASKAFRFANNNLPQAADHIRTEILIEHVTMTGKIFCFYFMDFIFEFGIFFLDLKNFTFPSPLDRLQLINVTILGQIQSNATSALKIGQLSIGGSRIGSIATGAFNELTLMDSLEMYSTWVDLIAERAFASAASTLRLENCRIGRMDQNALNMPVVNVFLRGNQIQVLATGALNLREWNQLMIENNNITLVERHAFYNIGEPKLLPVTGRIEENVRFIIRRNEFRNVQQGAFIISAQVPQLKLEENDFRQDCDCEMNSWASQLTQITRRTETTTTSGSPVSQQIVPDALWLGSSLFNSSQCWLDQSAAECLEFIQPRFLSMNNYTEEFCTAERKAEISRCVATKRSNHDIHGMAVDFQADGGNGIKLVSFSSRQDLLMIIVLGVLCAFVLLAVCLGLVVAHFRSKTRRQDRGRKTLSAEERVTCSPLIPNSNGEKQLGSGVVSSGSISRLSVKEYRNYLEELGPIYSEPMDPPDGHQFTLNKQEPVVPPQVPAMPVQWTPKNSQKVGDDGNKRTIDRGTQTLIEEMKVVDDQLVSSVQLMEPTTSSLALEFTEDVMAALKDKMDISPMYSEVKDSILSKVEEKPTAAKESKPELYDLIRVVDTGQRPSTSSAGSDHIYCKPWSASSDPLKSPFFPLTETPLIDKKEVEEDLTQSTKPSKTAESGSVKSQPFHVRGSLPKWPPPVREAKPAANRNRTGSKTGSSISPPASPTKETTKLPTWRSNSSRPTPSKKTTTRSESAPPSQKSQRLASTDQSKPQSNRKPISVESPAVDLVSRSPSPPPLVENTNHVVDDEYAEVTAQPFSFSFRRPLFADRQEKNGGPPKPARTTTLLCEYADPRDLNEPLYSELMVQDEKTQTARSPVI